METARRVDLTRPISVQQQGRLCIDHARRESARGQRGVQVLRTAVMSAPSFLNPTSPDKSTNPAMATFRPETETDCSVVDAGMSVNV